MKKFFKRLHLWLSLPAGIFIFILCLTGAILAFQTELQHAINPHFYYADSPEGKEALPLERITETAQQEASGEGKKINALTVYANRERNYEFGVEGSKGTYLTVNPYTAEITGKGAPGQNFFTNVRSLHRWILMSGDARTVGRTIIGISSLFLAIILICGIVFTFPKTSGQWKQLFSIKRGRNRHVLWFTTHRTIGWCCTIFLLLISLSGPIWSFSWYRSAIEGLFGIKTEPAQSANVQGTKENTGKNTVNTVAWNNALTQIKQQVPDYVSISLKEGSASVKVPGQHLRASDTYYFDQNGNITSVKKYADMPASSKLMGYVYIIHTGAWGGWITKLIYFLAAIGGAVLICSGCWLYGKRIAKKPGSRK